MAGDPDGNPNPWVLLAFAIVVLAVGLVIGLGWF